MSSTQKELQEKFDAKKGTLELPSGTKITALFIPLSQAVNVLATEKSKSYREGLLRAREIVSGIQDMYIEEYGGIENTAHDAKIDIKNLIDEELKI